MKTISVKLPKNPNSLLGSNNLASYIEELEATNQLEVLPDCVVVYYVLNTLYDEIMNGGFAQYLINQLNYTYPLLKHCTAIINNDYVKGILDKYISVCDKYNIAELKKENLYNLFDDIDNEFVKIDRSIGLRKQFSEIYKELYGEETRYINIETKEDESKLQFYNWSNRGVKLENALVSLTDFLNDIEKIKWDLEISRHFGTFTIKAYGYNELDFEMIMNNWVKNVKYHNVLLFKFVRILKKKENSIYDCITIGKSGYEKDEYAIERFDLESGFDYLRGYSTTIMFGASNQDLALYENKFNLKHITEYLKEFEKSKKDYFHMLEEKQPFEDILKRIKS